MKEKEKITQENLTTNFIKNLNQAMEEKNYTQTQLAHESGINRSQLNKILSGKAVPTTKTIVALCDTLEIDLGYLYGAYDEKNYDIHKISKITGLTEKAIIKLNEIATTYNIYFSDESEGTPPTEEKGIDKIRQLSKIILSEQFCVLLSHIESIENIQRIDKKRNLAEHFFITSMEYDSYLFNTTRIFTNIIEEIIKDENNNI